MFRLIFAISFSFPELRLKFKVNKLKEIKYPTHMTETCLISISYVKKNDNAFLNMSPCNIIKY